MKHNSAPWIAVILASLVAIISGLPVNVVYVITGKSSSYGANFRCFAMALPVISTISYVLVTKYRAFSRLSGMSIACGVLFESRLQLLGMHLPVAFSVLWGGVSLWLLSANECKSPYRHEDVIYAIGLGFVICLIDSRPLLFMGVVSILIVLSVVGLRSIWYSVRRYL